VVVFQRSAVAVFCTQTSLFLLSPPFLSSFQRLLRRTETAGFSVFQMLSSRLTGQHFGSFYLFFCSQSWSSTFLMSGIFANFSPKIKIFWFAVAFLVF
jgi:hypothetical protein